MPPGGPPRPQPLAPPPLGDMPHGHLGTRGRSALCWSERGGASCCPHVQRPPLRPCRGRVSRRPPPMPSSPPVVFTCPATRSSRFQALHRNPLVPQNKGRPDGLWGRWGQVLPRSPALRDSRGPALPHVAGEAAAGEPRFPRPPGREAARAATLRSSCPGPTPAPLAGGFTRRQLPALSGPQSPICECAVSSLQVPHVSRPRATGEQPRQSRVTRQPNDARVTGLTARTGLQDTAACDGAGLQGPLGWEGAPARWVRLRTSFV